MGRSIVQGRCDDRVRWYDVYGTLVRCHSTCLVRWYDVKVRIWYDGTMSWCACGAMMSCCGAHVVRWRHVVVRTPLLHQCTHCTAPFFLLSKLFFAIKTVFLLSKLFFATKKRCSAWGTLVHCYQKVVHFSGTLGTLLPKSGTLK